MMIAPAPVLVRETTTPLRITYDACPLCGCEDAEEVGVASCTNHPLYARELPGAMRWIRCDRCEHVFTDGYFSDEALAIVFRNAHPSQLPGPETARGRAIAAKIVEAVSTTRGSFEGRWLDVGFGNGALLATADEFGYETVAVDLREEAVQRMKALGFDARRIDVTQLDDAGTFDVISMADVLEHAPFPRTLLDKARRLLAPGGALFVSMPNLDAFAWKELDRTKSNPYWGELEHFHNFGRARLYALLREHGFEPKRYGISERYIACMEVVALAR